MCAMTTNPKHTAGVTNGDASPLAYTRMVTTRHSAFELLYVAVSGFLVGFCVAAGVGIILAYAVKVTGGIDGE